jgi:hypothetical protein
LTRAISGGVAAKSEAERRAEEDRRKAQSQGIIDLLRQRQAEDIQAKGRERLEAQRLAREKEERERAEGESALAFAIDQLPEDQRFDPAGMSTADAVREANVRRTIIAQRQQADEASARITGRQTPRPSEEERENAAIEDAANRLVTSGQVATWEEAMKEAQRRAAGAKRFFETGSFEEPREPLPPLQAEVRRTVAEVAQRRISTTQDAKEQQEILDAMRATLAELPRASEEELRQFLAAAQGGGAGGTF